MSVFMGSVQRLLGFFHRMLAICFLVGFFCGLVHGEVSTVVIDKLLIEYCARSLRVSRHPQRSDTEAQRSKNAPTNEGKIKTEILESVTLHKPVTLSQNLKRTVFGVVVHNEVEH